MRRSRSGSRSFRTARWFSQWTPQKVPPTMRRGARYRAPTKAISAAVSGCAHLALRLGEAGVDEHERPDRERQEVPPRDRAQEADLDLDAGEGGSEGVGGREVRRRARVAPLRPPHPHDDDEGPDHGEHDPDASGQRGVRPHPPERGGDDRGGGRLSPVAPPDRPVEPGGLGAERGDPVGVDGRGRVVGRPPERLQVVERGHGVGTGSATRAASSAFARWRRTATFETLRPRISAISACRRSSSVRTTRARSISGSRLRAS